MVDARTGGHPLFFPETMTDIEMNWDLTSYFAEFDGPEMRTFREDVARDLADLQARAQALETLRGANLSQWEEALLAAEDLWRRLSHLSSYQVLPDGGGRAQRGIQKRRGRLGAHPR